MAVFFFLRLSRGFLEAFSSGPAREHAPAATPQQRRRLRPPCTAPPPPAVAEPHTTAPNGHPRAGNDVRCICSLRSYDGVVRMTGATVVAMLAIAADPQQVDARHLLPTLLLAVL